MVNKFKEVILQDILDIRDGTHDSPKYVDEGFPLITSKNIKNGKIDFSSVNLISEEDFKKINKRSEVQNGDILMPMIGTIGNPVIVDTDNQFAIKNVALFKFDSDEKINNNYLFYYLKSDYFHQQIHFIKRGGTQSFISLSDIRNLKVPVFDITYQKRVVKILNKAAALIDKRKAQITALSDLTQSVFLEMFGDPYLNNKGWEMQDLKDITTIIMGQSPPGDSYNTLENGLPLLNGPAEFTEKYPKEKQWTTSPKKLTERGDILFCVRGATAGRMNFSDKTYAIGRGLAAVRVKDNNDLHYVYLTLKYMYSFFQNTSNGSTFINIDKKTLESIPIFKVENSMKEKYFQISEQLEKQQTMLGRSLLQLETNFNSLMQRAFKGELFND